MRNDLNKNVQTPVSRGPASEEPDTRVSAVSQEFLLSPALLQTVGGTCKKGM